MPRLSLEMSDSVKLLVAGLYFAAKPDFHAGLKSGQSVLEVVTKMMAAIPPRLSTLADEIVSVARQVFEGLGNDVHSDAGRLYVQMIQQSLTNATKIVQYNMDAEAICEGMISSLTDPEHKLPAQISLFRAITVPVLQRLLSHRSFADDLTPAFMTALLKRTDDQSEAMNELLALVRQKHATNPTGQAAPDALIMELALRYAPDSAIDLQSAYDGLEKALSESIRNREIASQYQKNDPIKKTTDRIFELNESGQLDEGQSELMQALQDTQAQRRTLLDLSISQARLRNDPKLAAHLISERLEMEESRISFETIKSAQEKIFEQGYYSNILYDRSLAMELARILIQHSRKREEICEAHIRVGTAFTAMGESSGNSMFLQSAVEELEQAGRYTSRKSNPYLWGYCKLNLSNARRIIGDRTANPQLLRQAARDAHEAYEALSTQNAVHGMANSLLNAAAAEVSLSHLRVDPALLRKAIQGLRKAAKLTIDPAASGFRVEVLLTLCAALGALFKATHETTFADEAEKAITEVIDLVDADKDPELYAKALVSHCQHFTLKFSQSNSDVDLTSAENCIRIASNFVALEENKATWGLICEKKAELLFEKSKRQSGEERIGTLREALGAVEAAVSATDKRQMPAYFESSKTLRTEILGELTNCLSAQ